MVFTVILFPSMVMHYKGAQSTIDPNSIKIEIPQMELPPLNFDAPKNGIEHKKPRSQAPGPLSLEPGDQACEWRTMNES